MLKKIIIGAMTAMFTFSTVFCPVNVSAEENSLVSAIELDKLAYDGDDLGAVYTPTSTTFKVWAPVASEVKLNLYATPSRSFPLILTRSIQATSARSDSLSL